ERPNQFAGRKLEDIKGEELAAIKAAAQQRTVESFAGPLHAPEDWWQKDLNMVKGSQAWLVVDPPDGKIPPTTAEAKARAAARNDDAFQGANGATLRLIERFTRVAPKTVKWAVTVDDPHTWATPWTFAMPLTMDDTQPVLEYACHEGNLGLRNILLAARSEEKKAAESAVKPTR